MDDIISVVVPVYNVEKYLRKCIESIISQTYKNLEIILVDDGSPDNSGKICDEYAEKDNRIKVIHKKNGGLSDARNVGIDASNGKYLMFVDSDDYIDSDMLEEMYNLAKKKDADIVIDSYKKVSIEGDVIFVHSAPNGTLSGIDILNNNLFEYFAFYVISCSKLFKRNLFNDLRYPYGRLHEDLFVLPYLLYRAKTVVRMEKPFYNYLQNPQSIQGRAYSPKRLDEIFALQELIEFYREHHLSGNNAFAAYIKSVTILYRVSDIIKYDEAYKNRLLRIRKNTRNHFLYLFKQAPNIKWRCVLLLDIINPKIMHRTKKMLLEPIQRLIYYIKLKKNSKKTRKKFDRIAFIIATPCHGNLGDHAIVYAEYEMLKRFGYSENIIEITNNEYKNYKDIIKRYILKNDVVIIDGGGSLGTLWPQEDEKISEIIDTYKNNKIIVFPQTCYYGDNAESRERLNKNKKIYKEATNLVITLRDRASYEFCRNNFSGVKLMFLPDIVLSLKKDGLKNQEDKCLICFREDPERVLTTEESNYIYSKLDGMDIAYEKISTIYPTAVTSADREERLEEIWIKISQSRLVITDRLHAMIFAAITGTPCLALDNKSKKVSGVYEWIKNLDYVQVCNDKDEFVELIPKFINMGKQNYNCNVILNEFNQLKPFIAKTFNAREGEK